MSLLSLNGVTKMYGALRAVDDVYLEVPADGRTVIVGASGSGKTTLLRLIAGFETPDAGTVTFDGNIVAGPVHVPAHRRAIGYVAQDGALFPHLTVGENVGFGLDRRELARDARIAQLLDAVQLPNLIADKRPHELSGGQQQRVALARALARRPKLMLLDEPFSALDAGLRASMRRMVADTLSAHGITSILVTHDQQEALSFANHLAVMGEGKLVQAGPPRELYLYPQTEGLALFLGEALLVEAEIRDGAAESALGRIRVGRDAAPGTRRVMLRPEQVRLVPWSEGAPTAEIVSASFEGPVTIVTFTAGGQRFSLKTSSADAPVSGAAAIVILGTGHVMPD